MKVRIVGPQKVRGSVEAPSSKAYTHRALAASLLAHGQSTIEKPLSCDDTQRTLEAIQALGASASRENGTLRVEAEDPSHLLYPRIDCGESGATLRFFTAISAALPYETTLVAHGPLSNRPLVPLLEALKTLGASVQLRRSMNTTEVQAHGSLRGGSISVPGNISSQFVSGLLLAAPLAMNNVEIRVTTQLESRPYVDMTLAVMRMHGVEVETQENGFLIPAPQTYEPARHLVPTDFSSAAFLLAAGITTGEELELSRVRISPIEPDSAIVSILIGMGARLESNGDRIKIVHSELEGFSLDAHDHPDLVPALEVLACQARGRSEIQGVGRLVHKESDRLRSIPEELSKMGAKITLAENGLLVEGGQRLIGGELSSHHDHRVAMACATASLVAQGTTIIDESEVVSKSYPAFYDDFEKMGVNLHVE